MSAEYTGARQSYWYTLIYFNIECTADDFQWFGICFHSCFGQSDFIGIRMWKNLQDLAYYQRTFDIGSEFAHFFDFKSTHSELVCHFLGRYAAQIDKIR